VSEGERAEERRWIEAESGLRILHMALPQPVDPKTCHLHSIEAREGNRLSTVKATTNDHTLRPTPTRCEETWDVSRVVLSVAIQGHHSSGPTPQRFGKTPLQGYSLSAVRG
jgi:hypothetical protein